MLYYLYFEYTELLGNVINDFVEYPTLEAAQKRRDAILAEDEGACTSIVYGEEVEE